MARVLLCSVGTAGDIHPFVAVGRALARRGHEVLLLANPHFGPRITAAGLGFWPLGTSDAYRAFVTDPRLVAGGRSPGFVIERLILPEFQSVQAVMPELLRTFRPAVAFVHHISFGAQAAMEAAGVPYAIGVLAPLFWLSRHESIIMPSLPITGVPMPLQRVLRRTLRPVGRWILDRPINRLRADAGLKPLRDVAITGARGRDGLLDHERLPAERCVPTLGLWSPAFRPPMPDDPSRSCVCGFCAFDPPSHTAHRAALERWLNDGDPPVLVTLGSSVSHHGAELHAAATQAARSINRRVLLLGSALPAPGGDAQVYATPYAPYPSVMPRAACIVHHAGIGTLAAAMASGRPSVIVPYANDEFDNAERARALTVATIVKRRSMSVKSLAAAMTHAMSTPAILSASSALAERMRTDDGPATAAAEIERLLA